MPRRLAFDVLQRVEEGAYSHIALATALDRADLSSVNRGLATQLVYGTLTWQRAIDDVIHERLKSGIKSVGEDGRLLLRLGVYQILFLERVPAHAAINETVEMAHALVPELVPVINAVLRRVSREMPNWWNDADRQKKPARYLGQRWSVPNWMSNRMLQLYGGVDRVEPLLEALSLSPPLWMRSRADDVPEGATPHASVPRAWVAENFNGEVLEGLKDGRWSVQDIAAQLVGHLTAIGLEPGAHVLDACAGLGGKSLHLASLGLKVHAVDPNASKISMLRDAAASQEVTNLTAEIVRAQDVRGDFDAVLLDAPCSGLGTIRRHPETRWTKTEADITNLAKIQSELLDSVVHLVKPGGVLVYSVCTWSREETSKQIELFLARHPEFAIQKPESELFDWAPFLKGDYVALDAANHNADGFFAARMIRSK